MTGNVENFLLKSNIVHDITNIGIDIAGHYTSTGAPANVNYARKGTVRSCTVYNCHSLSGDICAGIYVDGASDLIIEGNRSYRNDVGYSIGCEQPNKIAQLIRLRDNIATDNKRCGLYLGSGTTTSTVQNCTVTNNTFAQNFSDSGEGAEVILQRSSNCQLKQNIFLPRRPNCFAVAWWGYSVSNFSSAYNLYWRIGGNVTNMVTSNVTIGTDYIFGDPKFTSTTLPAPNYHLLSDSKAINKGDPAFAAALNELDIDALARVQHGRVDIGADESPYTAATPGDGEDRSTEISKQPVPLYPNPATSSVTMQFPEGYSGPLRICDVYGKVITARILSNEKEITLSLEQFPAGRYVVYADNQALQFVKQ